MRMLLIWSLSFFLSPLLLRFNSALCLCVYASIRYFALMMLSTVYYQFECTDDTLVHLSLLPLLSFLLFCILFAVVLPTFGSLCLFCSFLNLSVCFLLSLCALLSVGECCLSSSSVCLTLFPTGYFDG